MNRINYININSLNQIIITPDIESARFEYVEYKYKWKWFKKHKIAFGKFLCRTSFDGDYMTSQDILNEKWDNGQKCYIIKNNKVYIRACVIFKIKGESVCIYFDSYDEANSYANEFIIKNKLSNKLIKIEKGE